MKIQICYLMTPFPAATITPIGPFKLSTHPGKGSRQEGVTEKIKWKFVRGKWGRFEPPTLILDILMGSSNKLRNAQGGEIGGEVCYNLRFYLKKIRSIRKGKKSRNHVLNQPPPQFLLPKTEHSLRMTPTHFSYTMKHYQATSDF